MKELKPLPHAHSGSNVTHYDYDAGANKLYLKFGKSGKTAVYDDVTQAEADALVTAGSHGSHFSKHIKGKKEWRYV